MKSNMATYLQDEPCSDTDKEAFLECLDRSMLPLLARKSGRKASKIAGTILFL